MKSRCDGEVAKNINLGLRASAHTRSRVPYLSILLVALLALFIGSDCQGQSLGVSETVPQALPGSPAELDPVSIMLELNRAVATLKRGINENWGDRGRYLSAFEETPSVDSAGRQVIAAKSYVECVIDRHFRNHQPWDEGIPIDAEARMTVTELISLQKDVEEANEQARRSTEFHLSPCISSEHRRVVIAAGVAIALLKTKIDPIYPADALQHNISGTVTLHATIGTDGRIAALQVTSGPNELHQAALNAVRQWTYRPYELNNRPVEVETTINVAFNPSRQ